MSETTQPTDEPICEHNCENVATHDVVICHGDERTTAFVCEAHKENHEKHGVLGDAQPVTDELVARHYPRIDQ